MDSKSWLWRKKSSEKTIITTNKLGLSLRGVDEETQKLPIGNEVGPVRPVRNLNEQLASVLLDSHASKHEQLAQEAFAGHEKAEAEAACLKKELEEALKCGEAANERLTHSDAALKQCKQQLSSLQEEQEQKIRDALTKASSEFEKVQKNLEERLMETSKRLTNLAIENTNLSNALLIKEKLVGELHKRTSETVAEFNALMARLDSTEKENAFLKYEFHMLEKELEVRNEELAYTRQSADAARRQHLESVKKITKLEAECQRLRILVRKRLPGPAAVSKMKSEVDILGRDPTDLRSKPNPVRDLMLRDTTIEKSPEIPVKNINFLIEQLRGMEEENKTLREIMIKKNAELQTSRTMFSRTASRLSQVEAQLTELSGGQKSMELAKGAPLSNELSLIAGDAVSSSGSWANALISELEHFRGGKLRNPLDHKAIEISDMSLMDDFVEMEKLAIVSMQTPSGGGNYPLSAGKELVPVVQAHSCCSDRKQEIHSKDFAPDKTFDWLQVVLSAIFKQQHISKRSLTELLEDIKIALGYIKHPNAHEADTAVTSMHPAESDISGHITWKSPNTSLIAHLLNEVSTIDTSCKQCSQSNLSRSICKIIELIEGVNPTHLVTNDTADQGSKRNQSSPPMAAPVDYYVHVFQWKSSELSAILQRFVHTCSGLLNGKVGLENFAEELSFTLEWIMSNHVAPKDSSSARDKIKKHFGWTESRRENEVGAAVDCALVESDATCMSDEQSSCSHSAASSHDQSMSFLMERIRCNLQEENQRLKDELKNVESTKKDMEDRLQSATDKTEVLMTQLQESEQSIQSLQTEVETLKHSKGMIEDQIENQKSINEDLDTQLTVAKAKLNELLQRFSSLEVELDDKSNCCEELEATCLELQLQLESVTKKESLNYGVNEEGKQPQNGWEMTAASVKLAECQETILNLGKQLKALATPREVALFDKVFTTTTATPTTTSNKSFNKHFSLRDQILAEDSAKAIILRSPIKDAEKSSLNLSDTGNALSKPNVQLCTPAMHSGSKHNAAGSPIGPLAIVPSKKQGGFGLLRRLLLRRKKGGCKKSRSLVKI